MQNSTLEAKLLFAQNAIANARDKQNVQDLLAVYGYDRTKLDEGYALYEDADSKHTIQKKEYGEQYAATDALNVTRAETNAQYSKHSKLARIAFKNDRSVEQSLLLSGKRKESLSGWLKQVKTFFMPMP